MVAAPGALPHPAIFDSPTVVDVSSSSSSGNARVTQPPVSVVPDPATIPGDAELLVDLLTQPYRSRSAPLFTELGMVLLTDLRESDVPRDPSSLRWSLRQLLQIAQSTRHPTGHAGVDEQSTRLYSSFKNSGETARAETAGVVAARDAARSRGGNRQQRSDS